MVGLLFFIIIIEFIVIVCLYQKLLRQESGSITLANKCKDYEATLQTIERLAKKR